MGLGVYKIKACGDFIAKILVDKADIYAVMEAIIPDDYKGHLIEVARLGMAFSVTHTRLGKLIYTSTHTKEMDALRNASVVANAIDRDGQEIVLNIKTHISCPL